MTDAPRVKHGTLRWRVLVWACSDPGEWSIFTLAEDLDENTTRIRAAVYALQARGLLSCAYLLRPTPTGQRAIER